MGIFSEIFSWWGGNTWSNRIYTLLRGKLVGTVRLWHVSADKLVDIHEQLLPLIDQIGGILVRAGVDHVAHRIKPGASLPPDTEVAELITMLVRFRTQAVSAVSATLAFSIESTIEWLATYGSMMWIFCKGVTISNCRFSC